MMLELSTIQTVITNAAGAGEYLKSPADTGLAIGALVGAISGGVVGFCLRADSAREKAVNVVSYIPIGTVAVGYLGAVAAEVLAHM